MKRLIVVVALVAWALLVTPAAALPVLTVEAEDDSMVRRNYGVQDFNGRYMRVSYIHLADYQRKAYMKFDLSATGALASEPATLTVTIDQVRNPYGTGGSPRVRLYGLRAGFVPGVGELGTDWAESEIQWSNAPANADGQLFTSDAAWLRRWNIPASTAPGTTYSATIGRLGNFLQPDGTVTFMLASEVIDWAVYFASSESGTYAGPELTFTVPEPATLSLLALGGLALLRRRRR